MSWFKNLLPSKIVTNTEKKKGVPEGLWSKCNACQAVLFRADLERNLSVCPKCSHHQRIDARTRLEQFLDKDSWQEIASNVEAVDRLKFRDSKKYKDRISAAQKKTGETEALVVYNGKLHDLSVVVAAFNFMYLGEDTINTQPDDDWGFGAPYFFQVTLTYHSGDSTPSDD